MDMWLLHFGSLVLSLLTFIIVINNMTKKFVYPVNIIVRFKIAAVHCLDLQMVMKTVTYHPIPIITFSMYT